MSAYLVDILLNDVQPSLETLAADGEPGALLLVLPLRPLLLRLLTPGEVLRERAPPVEASLALGTSRSASGF